MRLLLVEDDAVLGPSVRSALQRAGYAVDLATDGLEAEAFGDIEPYDIVVLDLGLPKQSGLVVLANWRKKGNQVPVVILTARDTWQEKIEGFKLGADDYVGKPFQMEELLARLNAVLKRSQNTTATALSFSGIELEEDTQMLIHADGQRHALTSTEYRLLRYFMLNPGKVLSKTRLTEHVYEYDSDKDSNVIEVYVKRLRQKIGEELIQTRRGQGYVFNPDNANPPSI
ncbi:response regulator transcription factor [Methylotenera versatilis]|uniref:response regulator transcription factor n=1 Tax=Methylotenera versatilis TaxID=1055487 RepID=UPI00068BD47C|nr:response regulator transcription factor [Methylotenera versatilis]